MHGTLQLQQPEMVLAEFTDHNTMEAAFRQCRELRGVSYETLDELVGAPKGFFSKILAPRSQRQITLGGLGWLLAGLGLKCQLVSDPDTLRQIEARLTGRDADRVRSSTVQMTFTRAYFRRIGRKGAAARWGKHKKK